MPQGAPIPGKFDDDPRVHFDKTAGKWQYEDEQTGQEYEWNDIAKAWVPIIDEEQIKAQQAAYSVEGVDEEVSWLIHCLNSQRPSSLVRCPAPN